MACLYLATLAGACTNTAVSGPEAAQPLPADYRARVAAKVRETFFDPYSIRDASISDPIAGQAILGPVQTVCVRANAKNRMGGYTGLKETAFTFLNGNLSVDSEYAALTCAKAAYGPFPEIEQQPANPQPPGRR